MSAGMSIVPSPTPDSSSSMLATSGPPKSAEIAENDPAVETTARSRSPSRASRATTSDRRPERDEGRLGAEHGAEREAADRGERDPGRVRDRGRAPGDARERLVPAVARQEPPRRDDDERADDGYPEHEVPGRCRRVEELGQVVPEPHLELVHGGEKEDADERRRHTDERAQADEPQSGRRGHRHGRLRLCHARTVSRC